MISFLYLLVMLIIAGSLIYWGSPQKALLIEKETSHPKKRSVPPQVETRRCQKCNGVVSVTGPLQLHRSLVLVLVAPALIVSIAQDEDPATFFEFSLFFIIFACVMLLPALLLSAVSSRNLKGFTVIRCKTCSTLRMQREYFVPIECPNCESNRVIAGQLKKAQFLAPSGMNFFYFGRRVSVGGEDSPMTICIPCGLLLSRVEQHSLKEQMKKNWKEEYHKHMGGICLTCGSNQVVEGDLVGWALFNPDRLKLHALLPIMRYFSRIECVPKGKWKACLGCGLFWLPIHLLNGEERLQRWGTKELKRELGLPGERQNSSSGAT